MLDQKFHQNYKLHNILVMQVSCFNKNKKIFLELNNNNNLDLNRLISNKKVKKN